MGSPLVWLALCVAFLAPFVDPRRPARLLHLDLIVLLAFGGYPMLFGGSLGGLPLAYPALAYVLARLLYVGLRPKEYDEPLLPRVRVRWLGAGLVLLIGVRIAINLHEQYVIDIGQAGLIGVERILQGQDLYTAGAHVDTYGPLNYLAYLPFALLFDSDPSAVDPSAAHAAAIAFDLLAIAGLLVLGTRLAAGAAGRQLGVVLAYAWAAYPYTLFALGVNANDALLAALLVGVLLVMSSPMRRGAVAGAAAAVKIAPFALVPLLMTEPGSRSRRIAPGFGPAFGLVVAAAFLPFVPDGGLRELWDRTLGFQFGPDTRLSVWDKRPTAVQATLQATVVALCLALGWVPRRRSVRQATALAGAVLVAIQLAAQHWYYFYVLWFAPMAFVAFFGSYRLGSASPALRSRGSAVGANPIDSHVPRRSKTADPLIPR